MTYFVLMLLAFIVGYLLGQWRTLVTHEHEMANTNQELKFWQDIANRQRLALRGPLDAHFERPTNDHGITWKGSAL